MSSRSEATRNDSSIKKPALSTHPAQDVKDFRATLGEFLRSKDGSGRTIGSSKYGVYAFFDYDGEPIYVGQTKESLGTRVRRHLTNQRTDAVAMRVLDPIEVAKVQVWPLWGLDKLMGSAPAANKYLDALEYSVYRRAIENSRFGAILNEKIPPIPDSLLELPEPVEAVLISELHRLERGHQDVRIARRAESLARLTAVARERGEVTSGLRRVIVIQAIRLAYLGAERLAEVEGLPAPEVGAIDMQMLVGSLLDSSDFADNEESESDDINE